MARTTLTLLSLLVLAAPAAAGGGSSAPEEIQSFRLRGLDADGERTEVALRLRKADGVSYLVRRTETRSAGDERYFRGTGELRGGDLVVTYRPVRGAARDADETFKGRYRLGAARVIGVVETPAWDGSGRRVWTEVTGRRNGQTPWTRAKEAPASKAETRSQTESPPSETESQTETRSQTESPPSDTESRPLEETSRPIETESRSQRESRSQTETSSPSPTGSRSRSQTESRSQAGRSRSSSVDDRPIRPTETLPPMIADGTPTNQGDAKDRRLAELQRAVVAVARAELAKGVRETPARSNRGGRIDVYAKLSGMPTGTAWCGYFLGFVYTDAARALGQEFSGRYRLHSVGKTRSYFNYRSYTKRATPENVRAWDALRNQHDLQGSARRYMTLRGSKGDRWATSRSLSHEVYASYRELPVRAGDSVLFASVRSDTKRGSGRGHLALVESYDGSSGRLVTIEGNSGDRVRRRTRTLNASSQSVVDGFGRPALGDFTSPE
jgi:hypothetical protein